MNSPKFPHGEQKFNDQSDENIRQIYNNYLTNMSSQGSSQRSSSLSLQSETVIEEYANLDFSDEERDDFSSHSGDYRDLSDAQLKKLQVDKFPQQYAYVFQEPSTQDETYLRGKKKKPAEFDIDSFLNSHDDRIRIPRRPKNNSNKLQKGIKTIKEVSEESSIELITLPEPRASKHQKTVTEDNFALRFEQAKLNFMDSFLPDSMKIKNNPYSFFKYAHNKRQRII